MALGYYEPLCTLIADGTAITAAVRTSLTTGAISQAARSTLAANRLRIGDMIMVEASGRISSVVTTPGTAQFDLAFGASLGVAVMNSGAILLDTVAAHTNVGWTLKMDGTVRNIGTAASIFWQGSWICEDILGVPATAPKGVLTASLPWNTPPALGATFDSTVAQLIDLNFTQTVATGSCQLHQLNVTLKTSTGA